MFPPESGHTRRVRIFTPTAEIPFAGHPNIGTAFVLAASGELGEIDTSIEVTFEEKAGPVLISIHRREGEPIWCELSAPESLSLGKTISAESLASAVSLGRDDVVTTTHLPSAGLGGPAVSLRRTRGPCRAGASATQHRWGSTRSLPKVYRRRCISTYRVPMSSIFGARMFAPLGGTPEDPATGSANCALVADCSATTRRRATGTSTGELDRVWRWDVQAFWRHERRREGESSWARGLAGPACCSAKGSIEID